jgi:hypothetical protein
MYDKGIVQSDSLGAALGQDCLRLGLDKLILKGRASALITRIFMFVSFAC